MEVSCYMFFASTGVDIPKNSTIIKMFHDDQLTLTIAARGVGAISFFSRSKEHLKARSHPELGRPGLPTRLP